MAAISPYPAVGSGGLKALSAAAAHMGRSTSWPGGTWWGMVNIPAIKMVMAGELIMYMYIYMYIYIIIVTIIIMIIMIIIIITIIIVVIIIVIMMIIMIIVKITKITIIIIMMNND